MSADAVARTFQQAGAVAGRDETEVKKGGARLRARKGMKTVEVPIEKIHIGTRHRMDEGDLESLAANIRDIGLLQPIGIDEYFKLIFGCRRLIACGDILRWKTIPCVQLKIQSVLTGEYAENEFRKAFTASERVAISEALEAEELKKHQGKQLQKNISEVPGQQTRDKVADRVGFGNPITMRQAQRVVEKGAPAVIQAMDSGEVSIAAAAAIASQPKADQAAIIQMPKDERREAVRQIRKAKAEREADERRARDLKVYRGLYNAVKLIAGHYEDPAETWAGLQRVSALEFSQNLPRAIQCLTKLEKEHPNETRQPRIAT